MRSKTHTTKGQRSVPPIQNSIWKFFTIMTLITTLFFVHACKKDALFEIGEPGEMVDFDSQNPMVINFFDQNYLEKVNSNLKSTIVERTSNHLKDALYQNWQQVENETPFVSDLTNAIGFPHWNASRILGDSEVLLIPFVFSNATEVSGYMSCFLHENGFWSYLYHDRNQILNFATDQDFEINSVLEASNTIHFSFDLFETIEDPLINWLTPYYRTLDTLGDDGIQLRTTLVSGVHTVLVPRCNMALQEDPKDVIQLRTNESEWVNVPYSYSVACPNSNGPPNSGGAPGGPANTTTTAEDIVSEWIRRCDGLNDPGDHEDFEPPTQDEIDRCNALQQLQECDAIFVSEDADLLVWLDENGILQLAANHACNPFFGRDARENLHMFKDCAEGGSDIRFKDFESAIALMNELEILGLDFNDSEKQNLACGGGNELDEIAEWYFDLLPIIDKGELLTAARAKSQFLEYMQNPDVPLESLLMDDHDPAAYAMTVLNEYFSLKFKHCSINTSSGSVDFQNCQWSQSRFILTALFNASLERVHLGLDMIGFVPGAGEIADLTNGIIYTIEGDGFNATLSYSAAVPFLGWASSGAKLANKVVIGSTGRRLNLKYRKGLDGVVRFSYRGQLRRVLGLKKGDPRIAHHIIPWSLRKHELVQKAAKGSSSENSFHINDALNGYIIDPGVHSGGHEGYIQFMTDQLDDIIINFPGLSDAETIDKVKDLANMVRNWIDNNPGININEIQF